MPLSQETEDDMGTTEPEFDNSDDDSTGEDEPEDGEDDVNAEKADSDIILDFRNKRTGTKATLIAKYSRESDAIIAKMVIGRQTRYIKIRLRPIRQIVLNSLSNQVGWSWRDVKRASAKVVRKVGNKKLLSKVNKIMNDPRFAKGMALAGTIYPPLGISYGAIQASMKIVNAASQGNESAKDRILKIKALAESGNLDALKTVRAMGAINQAKKTGVDIGAWYNSIIAKNANPDRPNFVNKSRGFYATGITAPKRVIDVKVF